MTDWQGDELTGALLHGLVDRQAGQASLNFGPALLDNQDAPLWVTLRQELLTCRSFTISVAFITEAMVSNLKPILRELAARGVKGRLLTATYLSFNSPKVFAELLKVPNLTVRLASGDGFHQKGYWFDHGDYATFLVGSANLTSGAFLGHNQEWVLRLDSRQQGAFTAQFAASFARQWDQARSLTPAWLADYRRSYQAPTPAPAAASKAAGPITPNAMQAAALKQIAACQTGGARRALVISATGTGKTYLAALAVRQAAPKRLLFLAHRAEILVKARESFRRVLGGPASDYGLFTGDRQEAGARYLFATVQSLRRHRAAFTAGEFDYLIIDEVHHAGAASYRDLLDYFSPAFCLGMTATPERTDDFDLFALFDHQVAYEIRLPDALAAGMLVPFHYVGVADYRFQSAGANQQVDRYQEDLAAGRRPRNLRETVAMLTTDERVDYLLEQTAYYGHSGPVLHGLIFCASVAEAEALAAALARHGQPAAALSGKDPVAKRQRLIKQLEAGQLTYLVTVDLFNEGIDIPCVNQVVFLRNTNSPIVFQQQLGRGLRKAPGKDFLVVLDFIGNFKHNYLLPLALTGREVDADEARATVSRGSLVGEATIYFAPVARQRVLAALDAVRQSSLAYFRPKYRALKQRLGRVPSLLDFHRLAVADPLVVATAGTAKNYGQFLAKMGEELTLADYQQRVLTFLTAELLNGKRRQELLLLSALLNEGELGQTAYRQQLAAAGCLADEATLTSVARVLSLDYFAERARPTRHDYGDQPIVVATPRGYRWGPAMAKALTTPAFIRLVADAVATGLALAEQYRPDQPFTIGKKYTRKDAVRLINNPKNLNAQIISGYYFTNLATGLREGLFFVSYHKRPGIKRSKDYQNDFLGDSALRFFLNARDLKPAAKNVRRLTGGGDRLHLFVQHSNSRDQQSYYYLGTCHYQPGSLVELPVSGQPRLAVTLALDTPLAAELRERVTGGGADD